MIEAKICESASLVFELIGVKRHMKRYFSHICDAQMCKRTEEVIPTVGHNATDISHVTLTCPSYTDTEPPFLYGDFDTPPSLVAFYDTLGIQRVYFLLKSPLKGL